MIDVSHVLVLSQEQFLERLVGAEISRTDNSWTRFWPFGRK